jgi:hypothetical protein
MAKAKSNSPKKAAEVKKNYIVLYYDYDYWTANYEENRTTSEIKKEYLYTDRDIYIIESPVQDNDEKNPQVHLLKVSE